MVYHDEIPVKRSFTVENETEQKEDEEQESKSSGLWNATLTIGAAAGTALLAWSVNSLLSPEPIPAPGEQKDRKKMKQPGRKGQTMYRDDFEASPRTYFRGLNKEKKNNRK